MVDNIYLAESNRRTGIAVFFSQIFVIRHDVHARLALITVKINDYSFVMFYHVNEIGFIRDVEYHPRFHCSYLRRDILCTKNIKNKIL
jgi:hypothetical protein